MISRRLLRIKALQILFAFYRGESDSLAKAEKELLHSIKKGYDMYQYLFLLLLEIQEYAEKRIDLARQKLMPSHEDLHPNMRFVENPVFQIIRDNESIQEYLTYHKLSWVNYPELIKKLYQKITASEYYRKYMELESADFTDHKKVLNTILSKELLDFDDFELSLEEQSIYWNDDLEFMIGMVVKTIKKFEEDQPTSTPVLPMFKDAEDEGFAKLLMRKVVLKHSENTDIIDSYTKNWDVDRIAGMDILIMEMALTEITEFPSIPVKVSFNEYIEISKYYSTDQSSTFINGVLDKIISAYRTDNKVQKQGRGLIGEREE